MVNRKFYPSVTVDEVGDITGELLEKHNIKGLILDIDNTLAPNHAKEPDDKTVEWVRDLLSAGYKMCIVSNAVRRRVEIFNERMKLPTVYNAMKPRMAAFRKAGRILGLENRHIAVVGDQIFTDIYGGNRAGMFTILVNPIDSREGMFVRFKRVFERRILKQYEVLKIRNGKNE